MKVLVVYWTLGHDGLWLVTIFVFVFYGRRKTEETEDTEDIYYFLSNHEQQQ